MGVQVGAGAPTVSSPYWEPVAAALGSSPWWVPLGMGSLCCMHPGHPHPVSCAHSGVIVGASVSHYLLETSRVVFQVRPTLLLTPCRLPEWEKGRGHYRGVGMHRGL